MNLQYSPGNSHIPPWEVRNIIFKDANYEIRYATSEGGQFFFWFGSLAAKAPPQRYLDVVMSAKNPWDPGHHLTKPSRSLMGHESFLNAFDGRTWFLVRLLLGHKLFSGTYLLKSETSFILIHMFSLKVMQCPLYFSTLYLCFGSPSCLLS